MRIAVLTGGGDCPGLNAVIRAVVRRAQNHQFEVLGLRDGWKGLIEDRVFALTRENTAGILHRGGTILGTSRVNPFTLEGGLEKVMSNAAKHRIHAVVAIGGEGTLSAAARLHEHGLKVVGIPKTIDNDVMYTARTFGMITATEKAREVLDCAHNEATSAFNGVGLVKVMGRDAGFIAAATTLASQEVNFCLIPEVPFVLEGETGFLQALGQRLEERHHAVVVVAEGAGQDLLKDLPMDTDASGNKRYADIGPFLKEQIVSWCKRTRLPVDVKYFDPSYFIRSVPANCDDAMLCDQLARHAVHAGMAGKTDLVVGIWHGTFTHIPISLAVGQKNRVDPDGPLWAGVLATTGQPRRWE